MKMQPRIIYSPLFTLLSLSGIVASPGNKGMLFVESKPENGQITINDVQTGKTTPATFHEIDAGKHVVVVTSGELVGSTEVLVAPGKVVKCTVNLVETTPGDTSRVNIDNASLPGKLKISTVPPQAGIILNNMYRGRTPAMFNNLQPGRYSLMLTNRTHTPITRQLVLSSGAMLAVQDTFTQFTEKYLVWKRRQKKSYRLDLVLAGMGYTKLKNGVPVYLLMGAGVTSDLVFVFSVFNYSSHNKKSILAASTADQKYFKDRKIEDLIWAVSSFTTSLFLRLLSSSLTMKMDFE